MVSAGIFNLVIAVVVALVMSKVLKVVTREGDILDIACPDRPLLCRSRLRGPNARARVVSFMGVNVVSSVLGAAGLYLIVVEGIKSIRGDS